MKNIFKYDKETFLLVDNDVIAPDSEGNYHVPDGWTDIPFEEGAYLPKFYPEEGVWKETATQEYIDSLQPPAPEPDEVDLLKKQNSILSYQIAQLQMAVEQLKRGASE